MKLGMVIYVLVLVLPGCCVGCQGLQVADSSFECKCIGLSFGMDAHGMIALVKGKSILAAISQGAHRQGKLNKPFAACDEHSFHASQYGISSKRFVVSWTILYLISIQSSIAI